MVTNVLSRQPYSTPHLFAADASLKQKGIALAADFFARAGCIVGYPDKEVSGCDLFVVPKDVNSLPSIVYAGGDGTANVEVYVDENVANDGRLHFPIEKDNKDFGVAGDSAIWFHIYPTLDKFYVMKTSHALEKLFKLVQLKRANLVSKNNCKYVCVQSSHIEQSADLRLYDGGWEQNDE